MSDCSSITREISFLGTASYSYDDRYVSFKLDQFKEDLEGMNGIILRMNTRQNGVIYLQINMSKEK